MQSVYLSVIFHEKHKKIPLTAAVVLRRSKAFKNRFEILQHIKNSGEKFHPPPASLSLDVPRWGV